MRRGKQACESVCRKEGRGMTLLELQEILGKTIIEIEEGNGNMENAKAIASLAKQMINNADIILRTDKFVGNKGKRIDKVTGDDYGDSIHD